MTYLGNVMVVNILRWVYDLSSHWQQSSSPGIIRTITQKASGGDASRSWCREEKGKLINTLVTNQETGSSTLFFKGYISEVRIKGEPAHKNAPERWVFAQEIHCTPPVWVNKLHKSGNTLEDYGLIMG